MTPVNRLEGIDFLGGAMLLVDKPEGWTSFDVVNKIRGTLRYALGVKKIKVGHAGTLDPMATGLLLICTGKWTKRLAEFQNLDKGYSGTMTIGAETASFDRETEITATYPVDHITNEMIFQAAQNFTGEIEQIPPKYSAIKQDGVPLYKLARKGVAVDIKSRMVVISKFDITGIDLPEIQFDVHCSKGTYIRSLAYDFGKALDSGAYLSALRRDWIGPYKLQDAWQIGDLVKAIGECVIR